MVFRGKDGLQLIFTDKQDYEVLKEKLKLPAEAELFFQALM